MSRAKIPAPSAPPLMCANGGCPYEARVRVRRRRTERKQGLPNPIHVSYGPWLNLCHSCDDTRVRSENLEYCLMMGLDTPAKQRAWCLEQMKRGADMLRPTVTREPGQDDEEVIA